MKNKVKAISLIISLSFSIFCFCYLNFETPVPIDPSSMPPISESVAEADSKSKEILLPDLRFVERVSDFAIRLFKAL